VPAGVALFFPIVNAFDADSPVLPTVDDMRKALADKINGNTTLAASIDGEAISGLSLTSKFRTASPEFSIDFPAENVYHDPSAAGHYVHAVADGVYVLVAPLSTGAHTLHWSSGPGFPQDITYHLTVTR